MWKVVRASDRILEDSQESEDGDLPSKKRQIPTKFVHKLQRSKEERMRRMERNQNPAVPLRALPKVNINARWESLQTMMEMSDVGVFEFDPCGKLVQANDAWYRLSNHPREMPAHVDFQFMDLAYPVIMSAWNTLVQGSPVTFEMRWKARPGTNKPAQWILTSSVPVFDENRRLLSIAGNTIDINAQKTTQQEAQAKVEALEQARLSENKFAQFAQLAPIAIFIHKPGMGLQYVNDKFFELVGIQHISPEHIDFARLVVDDDYAQLKAEWAMMMDKKKLNQVQYRLKKEWVNQEQVRSYTWVQMSSYPELDDEGNVASIMGTMFDISRFKWAESVQRQRIEEALEAKRQQENFIDMTSHELRNPLSAVVQCADSVISTLSTLTQDSSTIVHREKFNDDINTCIDSLHTIVSCSLHQKRIIDDVLTLSKLDSNLLLITPARVQPALVVSDAIKIFEAECRMLQLRLNFEEDESLKDFQWVMMDPSRLLQVLFNILSNAIKFTKGRENRSITVTLGGSFVPPSQEWQTVTFAQNNQLRDDICDEHEWGSGIKGFVWLKVHDTGCRMTQMEQARLFFKFSQATPRTHIKYGGSGLGLFISKSLVALQGGSIGVSSEPSVGSTFAFYVSVRIAEETERKSISHSYRRIPTLESSTEEAMREAKVSVLIVEDNLVNQKVLGKQLKNMGCNVSVAGNGVEALDWLKQSTWWRGQGEKARKTDSWTPDLPQTSVLNQHLDIILMDVEMPVMDGLTCTRNIREYERQGLVSAPQPNSESLLQSEPKSSPHTRTPVLNFTDSVPHIPIIAVSANARSEQISEFLSAGMDDVITKPFRIPELWPKIAGLVPRCS
ncbi:unnamed protein product [Periconia digitata]|uniref:Histidine kinase n=1 Tax=Periconia digitata TaxID=1303443 RepID=A0A9W4ULU9_9PLEO|nr:unnamed protein product [Periconia digitata]